MAVRALPADSTLEGVSERSYDGDAVLHIGGAEYRCRALLVWWTEPAPAPAQTPGPACGPQDVGQWEGKLRLDNEDDAVSAWFASDERHALVLVQGRFAAVTVIDMDGPFLLVYGVGPRLSDTRGRRASRVRARAPLRVGLCRGCVLACEIRQSGRLRIPTSAGAAGSGRTPGGAGSGRLLRGRPVVLGGGGGATAGRDGASRGAVSW
ncbi:hypothetical protein GCM10009663_73620 [Kitasatospora arboriphila]|uniref:Uncharacterized protein n=1 Tax=Kitasatospora arboriphila TaxID=258052 RepID=A0ABN1U636_9ACTN